MLSALTYEDRLVYFYDDDPYREAPDIFELFRFYNQAFFDNKLLSTSIKWSTRMTLCAGTCKYEGQGSSTITLSEPLLKFRSNNELKETVIHEMIHAFWFATDPESCKVNEGHGPKFLEMMHAINSLTSLSVTVYHQFHDEVDRCRQHIWKCDGPCQKLQPFFGIVKRSMNRAPQPADLWFARHQQTCGGVFTKIQGPPSIPKIIKQKKQNPIQPKKSLTKNSLTARANTLEQYFFSPNLKSTTCSFMIDIILTNDHVKVSIQYDTPKDFNYKELSGVLCKLYSHLGKLSPNIQLDEYDFKEQMQNKQLFLWKDVMQKNNVFECNATKLIISLEESDQEVQITTLSQLTIVTALELLTQEESIILQINK